MTLPIFILGNPRSGTTLLRLMLTSHPQIVIPPECGFAMWWRERYGCWSTQDSESSSRVAQFVRDLLTSRKIETWGLDAHALESFVLERCPPSYAELVSAIYEFYGLSQQRSFSRWGDKNNYYIQHVPELLALFPDAYFVHIVRDGRDVACSYVELHRKQLSSRYAPRLPVAMEQVAKEWRDSVSMISTSLRSASRRCEIRFEDLVRNTKSTLEQICESVGEEFSPSMLEYYRRNSEDSLEPPEFLQWKARTLEPPTESVIGRYRTDLTLAETETFERIAREQLQQYGYM